MNFRPPIFDCRLGVGRGRRTPPRPGSRVAAAAGVGDPALHSEPLNSRGSVLIIVMVTLMFAAFALVAFMDKATNDLLVDHRDARAKRLRLEAYSALEVTLAVLEDFRLANNGLHSPAEGWSDPLEFAGYTPTENRTIVITFEDESGKVSLPRADKEVLKRLFENLGVSDAEADMYADAMMGWMKRDHVYSTAVAPDYEHSDIPFDPPARPMRSYTELAAIDKVREFFYEKDGRPNDNWRQFVANVSLFDFAKPNINGARPGSLAAIGQYDQSQQGALLDYMEGRNQYANQGRGYVTDTNEVAMLAGGQGGNAAAFGTTISALRIFVTVSEGRSEFKLATVVTTGNAARAVRETATSQKKETSTSSARTSSQRQAAPNASQPAQKATADGQNATKPDLRYPFKLLEIRENDEIPAAPTPPPPDGSA